MTEPTLREAAQRVIEWSGPSIPTDLAMFIVEMDTALAATPPALDADDFDFETGEFSRPTPAAMRAELTRLAEVRAATPPALDNLRALSDAATPGHWFRYTVGHRSVRQAAGAVTQALFSVDVDPEVRPLMTDLSWVETDASEAHVALIGNGPKQTDNAEFIAACVNFVRAALSTGDET